MMTKDSRTVLNDRELNAPVVARKTKGPIQIDRQYMLIRHRIFDAKGRCDICENENKAGVQVFIHDSETDTTLAAGMSCLREVFGFTEANLDKLAGNQVSVAARIADLTGENYGDRREMLAGFRYFIASRSVQHPEIAKCLRILNDFKERQQLQDSHYEQIGRILDFYHLVSESIGQPELYADRIAAVLEDPVYEKTARTQAVNVDIFRDVEKLTMTRVETFRKFLKAMALKSNLPRLANAGIAPWEYPDKPTYLAALSAHYVAQADAGTMLGMGLQASYDHVHFNYEWDAHSKTSYSRNLSQLAALVQLPSVFPVFLDDRINQENWRYSSAGLVEAVHGLHQEGLSRSHYHSLIVHQGLVRTTPPEDRRSYQNLTSTDDQAAVPYRCSAFWKQDRIYPVYRLWRKYQARGGREFLLSFPVTAKRTA